VKLLVHMNATNPGIVIRACRAHATGRQFARCVSIFAVSVLHLDRRAGVVGRQTFGSAIAMLAVRKETARRQLPR
jgi:hypothetical protein